MTTPHDRQFKFDDQKDETDKSHTWGLIAHLSALSSLAGVPFGNILGPLIVWLIKKDEMPFVDDQGREALNFQITLMIAGFALVLAAVFLVLLKLYILLIVILALLLVLMLYNIALVIVATIKASEGVRFRYPLTIRLL